MSTQYDNPRSVSTSDAHEFHDRDRNHLRSIETASNDALMSVYELGEAIETLRGAAPRSIEVDGAVIEALHLLLNLTNTAHDLHKTATRMLADHEVTP